MKKRTRKNFEVYEQENNFDQTYVCKILHTTGECTYLQTFLKIFYMLDRTQ